MLIQEMDLKTLSSMPKEKEEVMYSNVNEALPFWSVGCLSFRVSSKCEHDVVIRIGMTSANFFPLSLSHAGRKSCPT